MGALSKNRQGPDIRCINNDSKINPYILETLMKPVFKTILIAASLVGMSTIASANEKIAAYNATTNSTYVTTTRDLSAANTTNIGYGKHYNSFSNDYRQPEMLTTNYVTVVQRELADQGFYNGRIDGIWGQRTTNAIRAYQDAHGQPLTGELSTRAINDMGISYNDNGMVETTTRVIDGRRYQQAYSSNDGRYYTANGYCMDGRGN
jgi:hypothetical protein